MEINLHDKFFVNQQKSKNQPNSLIKLFKDIKNKVTLIGLQLHFI
jgi:hypothetical protein